MRLVPDEPLPPYAHVPGRTPHPLSDPRGHGYGRATDRPPAPDPERWASSRDYLRGIDLFNHGYYWEAHEVWEGLWHARGRKGPAADFLRALIKLAAAGVKVREGRPDGVRSHARRAADVFRRSPGPRFFGLDVKELVWRTELLASNPPPDPDPTAPVAVVFDFTLRPA